MILEVLAGLAGEWSGNWNSSVASHRTPRLERVRRRLAGLRALTLPHCHRQCPPQLEVTLSKSPFQRFSKDL